MSLGKVSSRPYRAITREEVAKHNKKGDVWIVIDSYVYDVSGFVDVHPGGVSVLLDETVAGQDCTDSFFGLHRSEVLEKYPRLIIGRIPQLSAQVVIRDAGDLSRVPHSEPLWLTRGYFTPYYNDSHHKFHKALRRIFDDKLRRRAWEIEESGKWDLKLLKEMSSWNFQRMRLGPGKHLHGILLPGELRGEEYDYFHELIFTQEIARIGARTMFDGFVSGLSIGLSTVYNYGSKEVQEEIMEPCLNSDKFICLAITEAFMGSDVAGIHTTATKTEDGQYWIINGTKKWITNGMFADYFATVCKTGPNGHLTMILVKRGDGLETKQIHTSYSTAAGTAFVTYDNVKVPVKYTLGQEGKGLNVTLSNFNHERWMMNCGMVATSRAMVEECFKWSHQRKVFGKPLIQQPVIRQKFAGMFSKIEVMQSWLESITYQMTKMNYSQQSDLIAGQIALQKMFLTRNAWSVADEAVQIFGGRGITKTGMGKLIENFHRTVKFEAILGGSEEVLGDLGVRQAMRKMPKVVL